MQFPISEPDTPDLGEIFRPLVDMSMLGLNVFRRNKSEVELRLDSNTFGNFKRWQCLEAFCLEYLKLSVLSFQTPQAFNSRFSQLERDKSGRLEGLGQLDQSIFKQQFIAEI